MSKFATTPCPSCGSLPTKETVIVFKPSSELVEILRKITVELKDIAWELSNKRGGY